MENNMTVEELLKLNNVKFFEAIFTSTKEIALIIDKLYDKEIKMCELNGYINKYDVDLFIQYKRNIDINSVKSAIIRHLKKLGWKYNSSFKEFIKSSVKLNEYQMVEKHSGEISFDIAPKVEYPHDIRNIIPIL